MSSILQDALMSIGFALCHQLPERSLFIAGEQLPVCARDTGTFLGFGLVLLFYVVARRWLRAGRPDNLVLAAAGVGFCLFAFDAASSYLGLRETDNTLRLISGLGMGLTIGVCMLTVLSLTGKGDQGKACFQAKDLLVLLPLLVLGYLMATTDLGLAWYYLVSMAIVAGMVLLFMTMFFLLAKLLLEKRLEGRGPAIPLAVAAACTVLVLSLAYAFHSLTLGMVSGA